MNLKDKFLNSIKRPTNHVIKTYRRAVKSPDLSKIKGLFNKRNILNCVENVCSVVKQNRTNWIQNTFNEDWWEETINKTFNDSQFLNTFRMRKNTFKEICSLLVEEIKPNGSFFNSRRHPLEIKKIVTIALYKLVTGSDDKRIGNKFLIHESKIGDCLVMFIEAVVAVMTNEIKFPSQEECTELAGINLEVSNLPQIIGYLGRIRVPFECNPENDGFKNFKGVSSYVFQGMVDYKFRFRSFLMTNGSVPDDVIYQNSSLYKKMNENKEKILIPFQLISDQSWLVSVYQGEELTEEQKIFNDSIKKLQMKGEKTFIRFKGRWRILTKKIQLNHNLIPNLYQACCILHNFLENREEYLNDWNFHSSSSTGSTITWNAQNNEADAVREVLKNSLF